MSIQETREFWNTNPCGAHDVYSSRAAFRFRKEAWLPHELKTIASRHGTIVELGCGQGTDSIVLCHLMRPSGSFFGLDLSEISIASARRAAKESLDIVVKPAFHVANCEALPFADNSVECIYSMGVLHHTPDIEKALSEVLRVLRPNGVAYIALYSKQSPKVAGARFLRGVQHCADHLTGRKDTFLPLARLAPSRWFGTMFLECFGVPILNAYSRREIERLFSAFDLRRLERRGSIGTFWFIEATKGT